MFCFVSFGEKIKNEVELPSTVVVVMSAVPINLSTLLTDVERLEDSQRAVSHRRLNLRSVVCSLSSIVSLPLPQTLVFRKINLGEHLVFLHKADKLVRDGNLVVFQFDHVNLRGNKKLITVTNHTTTEHVASLNVDLEVRHDLLKCFKFVRTFRDQESVAKLCVLLILREKKLLNN